MEMVLQLLVWLKTAVLVRVGVVERGDASIIIEAEVGCVAAILLEMIAVITDRSRRRPRLLPLDGLRRAPIDILQTLIGRGLAAPLEGLLMMSLHLHRLEVVI